MKQNLAERLSWLGFRPLVDFVCRDDGDGPYLAQWLSSQPQPDAEAIAAATPPPEPFKDLTRPAFLFMMNKIGVSEATVEGIISAVPEDTTAKKDAKALALIVFKNQQTFRRDNPMLQRLAKAAGLTETQVDAAWRQAEQIVW